MKPQMTPEQTQQIAGVLKRAIEDGLRISVYDQDAEQYRLRRSVEVLTVLETLKEVDVPSVQLVNNIGNSWVATIFLLDGEDDEAVYGPHYLTDQHSRIAQVMGELA